MGSTTSKSFIPHLATLAILAIGGCNDATSANPPGTEGGPCIEGACFDGFQCLSDICVEGSADGTTTAPPGGEDGTSSSMPETSGKGDSTTASDSSDGSPGEEDSDTSASTDGESTSTQGEPDTGTTGDPDPTQGIGFIDPTDPTDPTDGIGFIDPTDPTDPTNGNGFIGDPTGGGVSIECSPWEQDCLADEKCMPWANDGGNSWNATRCSPLDPNPDAVGEACAVEGSGVSGVDTCELGSICWDVDPDTNEGTCVAQCIGSPEAPSCPTPGATCSVSNDGVLTLCLEGCDPLLQDCNGVEQACYPQNGGFVCAPVAANGPDDGQQGDPCQYLNSCDEGLQCANGDAIPNCPDVGCCTSYCDLDLNDSCNVLQPGLECLPLYEPGDAPPGLGNVGTCVLPN